jgi:hypothetical protein
MEQLLATMLSPQETDMGRWIHDQGGEEVVLASYEKCAKMIEYEASLTAPRRIGSLSAGKISGADAKKIEAEAVAALRREYHEDIQGIIQENFGRFSNYFDSKLEDFGKDLENEIRQQGDRVIKHLKGGPHSRIKDKVFISCSPTRHIHPIIQMISHLWEDQVSETFTCDTCTQNAHRVGKAMSPRAHWSWHCMTILRSGFSVLGKKLWTN